MNALPPKSDFAAAVKARPWLTDAMRADFARDFDCDPAEVEARLDAHEVLSAKVAERLEYEDPYGYQRGRF